MSRNEYIKKYRRKQYQRYRSNGNCIDCGLPSKPYWRCFGCRVKVSKRNKRYYQKHKDRIKKQKHESRSTKKTN